MDEGTNRHPARFEVLEPRFDEQSIFLMGISLFALYLFDPKMHEVFSVSSSDGRSFGKSILFGGILFISFAIACINVFIRRSKSSVEKSLLLFCGVFVSFVIGLTAGVHLWEKSSGVYLIFPIWNLIAAGTAIWLYNSTNPELYVSDRDTTLLQLVAGVMLVIVVVQYGIREQLHWSVTFSICLAYAQSLDSILFWIIHRFRRRGVSE